MGTRGLTVVIQKATAKGKPKLKIAQYGQWDHYPDGNGLACLKFLRETDLKVFAKKLKLVRFSNRKDRKAVKDFMESIGSKDGWMNGEQSEKYHVAFPLLTRDNGSAIMGMVNELNEKAFLTNSIDFAGDSLFCEYAYVIDFDTNTFEVYEGFNKTPLTETDRFFQYTNKASEYHPVKLLATFSLDTLPTDEEFLIACKVDEND